MPATQAPAMQLTAEAAQRYPRTFAPYTIKNSSCATASSAPRWAAGSRPGWSTTS